MDNRLIFRYHPNGAKQGRGEKHQPLSGLRCQASRSRTWIGKTVHRDRDVRAGLRATSDGRLRQEKLLSDEVQVPVPQTDTGRQVENTKARGRPLVKELGKIDP